jgi:hypothetical protein
MVDKCASACFNLVCFTYAGACSVQAMCFAGGRRPEKVFNKALFLEAEH